MSTQTEQIVSMPITNPATRGTSRTFEYRGKVDRIEGGRLVDWKSVSDPQDFLNSRAVGYQGELYTLALAHCGIQIMEIAYRLVKRPTIKFCGKDKTADDYEARCVEWLRTTDGAITETVLLINRARLEQARQWLWNISQRLLQCRRSGCWLTNENACQFYSRNCEFLPICLCQSQGGDVEWIIGEQYEPREIHEELDDVPAEKDVITYSSATKFTLCEARYYFQHERKIGPKSEVTATARWTGSAFHVGMDVVQEHGVEAALIAIGQWADNNPIIGPEAYHTQQQHVAQARAIVQCAWEVWGIRAVERRV